MDMTAPTASALHTEGVAQAMATGGRAASDTPNEDGKATDDIDDVHSKVDVAQPDGAKEVSDYAASQDEVDSEAEERSEEEGRDASQGDVAE